MNYKDYYAIAFYSEGKFVRMYRTFLAKVEAYELFIEARTKLIDGESVALVHIDNDNVELLDAWGAHSNSSTVIAIGRYTSSRQVER